MSEPMDWRDVWWFLRCKVEWWLWVKWRFAMRRRRKVATPPAAVLTFRGVPIKVTDRLEGT